MSAVRVELDNKEKVLSDLFSDNSDWISYYYKNSMNAEFLQYTEYYIRALKDFKKILIIEDDPISFRIIQSFIKTYDEEVKCFYAANENDAIEIINTFHCDLIIADYFIEGDRTGLDICRRVSQEYPEITCTIVSSLKHYQYQEILKYADTEPMFFEKPVSKKKMVEFLDQFYGGRHV